MSIHEYANGVLRAVLPTLLAFTFTASVSLLRHHLIILEWKPGFPVNQTDVLRWNRRERKPSPNDTVSLFHQGVPGETYKTPSGRVNSVTKVTFIRAGPHEHPSFVRSKGRRLLFPHIKSNGQRRVCMREEFFSGKNFIGVFLSFFNRDVLRHTASRRRCQVAWTYLCNPAVVFLQPLLP